MPDIVGFFTTLDDGGIDGISESINEILEKNPKATVKQMTNIPIEISHHPASVDDPFTFETFEYDMLVVFSYPETENFEWPERKKDD